MRISQVPMAKKYATAYLNIYEPTLTQDDMRALSAAFSFLKSHRNFMLLVCTLSADKGAMVRVFEKLVTYFSLPSSIQTLMQLLLKHKRICFLTAVLQDICCLYKMRHNIIEVEIQTADDLDPDAVKEFERFFEHLSGKKVESEIRVDRSLIAGVRLQSDFLLWDYSVASRLRALRHKLVIEG